MALIDRLVYVDTDPPVQQGIVYKYCPPERTDILKNLKLRLTQPGAFNDPFEGYPYTRPYTDEEFSELIDRHKELPGIYYIFLQRLYRDGLLEREWSRAEVLQDPIATGKLLWEHLDLALERELRGVDRRDIRHLQLFDLMLGIVSLSEINDNILMWGLYAESHTGLVFGFDAGHEFFASSKFGIRPVEYTDQRPTMTRQVIWDIRFHLTKATIWSYEKEWRFIAPLSLKLPANIPQDSLGYPIVLTDLPASLIKSVTFGARMGPDARRSVAELLSSTPALSHVEIFQASLDSRCFRVNIEPWRA
jgi:Protein of unknown function (DUF2971)